MVKVIATIGFLFVGLVSTQPPAPVVAIQCPTNSVGVGQPFQLNWTISTPQSNIIKYVIDWGDGTSNIYYGTPPFNLSILRTNAL